MITPSNHPDAAHQIAKALLEIGAVGFAPHKPITFKSGMISPVYVDNRKLPFYPDQWKIVITGFAEMIATKNLEYDVIAGIATAGIPHSAALGYVLEKPSVFIRKESKNHGTKKLIEGGSVEGKKVLLIEDLVTTGSSSLAGVTAVKAEQGTVTDCCIIVGYGFAEATLNFAQAQVALHALTTFEVILEEALVQGLFNQAEKAILQDWFSDPWGWAKRQGFAE
jgi:orotate phosphoribosyltransferase